MSKSANRLLSFVGKQERKMRKERDPWSSRETAMPPLHISATFYPLLCLPSPCLDLALVFVDGAIRDPKSLIIDGGAQAHVRHDLGTTKRTGIAAPSGHRVPLSASLVRWGYVQLCPIPNFAQMKFDLRAWLAVAGTGQRVSRLLGHCDAQPRNVAAAAAAASQPASQPASAQPARAAQSLSSPQQSPRPQPRLATIRTHARPCSDFRPCGIRAVRRRAVPCARHALIALHASIHVVVNWGRTGERQRDSRPQLGGKTKRGTGDGQDR